MGQESPDMSDVKKCLEDAGLFERRMEKSDMISYYNIIKSSEASASEESSRRRERAPSEEPDEPAVAPPTPGLKRAFTPKVARRPAAVKRFKQPELRDLDVTKCAPIVDKLAIARHEPKRPGPFYTHREFRSLSVDEKIRRIAEHHLAMAVEYDRYQRRSVHLAEWGPPVLTSAKCGAPRQSAAETVRRPVQDEPDLFQEDPQEVYTFTLSGRQVKRKVYTEMDTDDTATKKKTKPSQPKRSSKKPPSNTEIIARSSLFADSPKSRSEILFDHAVKEDAKRAKEEEEASKFTDSLGGGSDDDFDLKVVSSQAGVAKTGNDGVGGGGDEAEFLPDGTKLVKMRVIPPVAGRKGYRRKQALVPVAVDENVPTNSKASTTASQQGKSPSPRPENAPAATVTSRQSVNRKPDPKCPICSRPFPQKDIEAHASTCGLTAELEIENNLPNKDGMQMLCNICDQVFPLSTDYEHHVVQCIQANK